MTDRSTLYRMFNADGELIYVGITFDPQTRFTAHRRHKVWWDDVATIEVQHFTDREQARRAEQEMIAAQKPLFNVSHRSQSWHEGQDHGTEIVVGECDRCGQEDYVPDQLGGLCGRCETELQERGEVVA